MLPARLVPGKDDLDMSPARAFRRGLKALGTLPPRPQTPASTPLEWEGCLGTVKKPATAIALVLALGAQGAWADSVHHRLHRARVDQASALTTLHSVQGQLAQAGASLATAQRLVDSATVRLIDARTQERDVAVQYALARDVLVRRIRMA